LEPDAERLVKLLLQADRCQMEIGKPIKELVGRLRGGRRDKMSPLRHDVDILVVKAWNVRLIGQIMYREDNAWL